MATASDLKQKVAKISTIVEYLEDEQINQIEKDILLQAIRDLYTDILLTKVGDTAVEKDECEKIAEEENNVNEPQENIAESSVDVPPVIAVAFDGCEINFSNLIR